MVIIMQYLRAWCSITITNVGARPTRWFLLHFYSFILILTLVVIKGLIDNHSYSRILALLAGYTLSVPNIPGTTRSNNKRWWKTSKQLVEFGIELGIKGLLEADYLFKCLAKSFVDVLCVIHHKLGELSV